MISKILTLPQWVITGVIVLFTILVLLSFGKFVIFCIGVLTGVVVTLFLKAPVQQLKQKLKLR